MMLEFSSNWALCLFVVFVTVAVANAIGEPAGNVDGAVYVTVQKVKKDDPVLQVPPLNVPNEAPRGVPPPAALLLNDHVTAPPPTSPRTATNCTALPGVAARFSGVMGAIKPGVTVTFAVAVRTLPFDCVCEAVDVLGAVAERTLGCMWMRVEILATSFKNGQRLVRTFRRLRDRLG